MKVNATYSDIWKIAYPIILGSLATTVLNLTNTAFLARVGETELGAIAIAGVFYFVIIMIGIALGTGSQIMMSRRAGEGNITEIGKLFDHSFIILTILAIIVFVFMKFLTPSFFGMLLHSKNILTACNNYMSIRSYGVIFTLTGIAFRSFYIGISQTRIMTYSAVLMMVINIILDYLLIFGNYGFPKMGIEGAALASVISEFTGTAYLVIYSALKHEFKQFQLFRFDDLQKTRMLSILRISSPMVVQNTLSMGAWFLFFVFIERIGEHELAISNIVRATYMILMTPFWGYASATNSMVSNLIGQGKEAELKVLLKKIITLSLLTAVVLFIISVISPQWLLRITTSDYLLIKDAIGSYYVTIASMFLFAISIILLNAVSGMGHTNATMIIEFFNIIVYMFYVYICAVIIKSSIETVWFSEIIYWLMMGILSAFYLRSKSWKHAVI